MFKNSNSVVYKCGLKTQHKDIPGNVNIGSTDAETLGENSHDTTEKIGLREMYMSA